MAKNKNRKLRKILIAIVIILVILVFLLLILLNQSSNITNEALEKLEYINSSEEWDEETCYADNTASVGTAYVGDLSIRSMGKSMYYIATELFPKYYSELKDASYDEIIQYYEKNKEEIYVNIAIEREAQFVNIIQELQTLSGDLLTWSSYRIDLDSIKTGSKYTKAVLYITYENNKEIAFNIKVKNTVSDECSTIVYTAISE